MELKNFKPGDIIVQKNDPNIRWVVVSIDPDSVQLCRKGGYFNDMLSKFNGNNQNFEPAGKTENRINRENKIDKRKQAQEDYKKTSLRSLIDANSSQSPDLKPIINTNKQIRPKEVASLSDCSVKTVLEAIHEGKLKSQLSGKKEGKGIRYLINYTDAQEWAEQYKYNSQPEEDIPNKSYLTVKEISDQTQLSETTIRSEIKNGKLKAENANPKGKIPRYISKIEWVEEWNQTKDNKQTSDATFEDVKINNNNQFTPGSRMYCYFEVFLENGNQATYKQLMDGCISKMPQFGIVENEDEIKKDLNNKIHHWQQGRLGLRVDLDKTNCRLGEKGKMCHGELGKALIIIREIL